MGVELVGLALSNVCPQLGRFHASRVALLVMARVALDTDTDPWYQAGWEPIANALGLAGSDRDKRDRVAKVVQPLLDMGALYVIAAAAPGRRVRYGLQVTRKLRVVRAPEKGASGNNPQGVDKAPKGAENCG